MTRENTSKSPLLENNIYHIVSRSIAKYQIFNTDDDYLRMVQLLRFYQVSKPLTKYSMFFRLRGTQEFGFDQYFNFLHKDHEKLVNIIAYCLMPNHIHLVLKQLKENGISIFMANILNSYSRYFNLLQKRKGPLWESKFKNILVKNDEQLLHLVRYIHTNPYAAKLVNKIELWKYSSYVEHIKPGNVNLPLCDTNLLDISPENYRKFVNDRKDYQRKLSEIKNLINM